jgi:hypothetical protein
MMVSEFRQNALTLRRKGEKHLTLIIQRSFATHVSSGLEAVDEFDRAVMLNLQARRQLSHSRPYSSRHALNGQHQLILATLQPRGLDRLLAEVKELPYLKTEFGQCLIVG